MKHRQRVMATTIASILFALSTSPYNFYRIVLYLLICCFVTVLQFPAFLFGHLNYLIISPEQYLHLLVFLNFLRYDPEDFSIINKAAVL